MIKARKIARLSPLAISALVAGLATAPSTMGVSYAVMATPIAIKTVLSISTIIIAASIGVTIIISAFQEYDIEITCSGRGMHFKRKKNRN